MTIDRTKNVTRYEIDKRGDLRRDNYGTLCDTGAAFFAISEAEEVIDALLEAAKFAVKLSTHPDVDEVLNAAIAKAEGKGA